jgi:thiamine transporter ThiT
LPIYFFTLIAGWRFGLAAGLATAVLSPIANHALTGMPPQAMLPAILAKSVLLAVIASWVARRFGLSLAAVALAVVGYQAAGGVVEALLTASLPAALEDFRVGLPGITLQILGGYAVLRLLARAGDR